MNDDVQAFAWAMVIVIFFCVVNAGLPVSVSESAKQPDQVISQTAPAPAPPEHSVLIHGESK